MMLKYPYIQISYLKTFQVQKPQLVKDLQNKVSQMKKQLNVTNMTPIQNISQYSQLEKQNDEIWKNRMQTIPIIAIIISMQNWQIVHKNQSFYDFFSSYKQTEEELENLVMNHLSFHVSSSNLEEQDVSSINQFINQIRRPHAMTFNNNCNQRNQETLQDIPIGYQSLNEIVLNFKSKVQSSFLNIHHSVYYEITCRQQLEDGSYLQLFGQIVQNEKDNEILIFLNDFSGQNEMQQNILLNDFKSKILQSFSHELRTPLNSALNFLSSSLQEQKIPLYVKDNLIEPAINSLKIQKYLINDILDFSSFYQDHIKIQLKEFTISELITEIIMRQNPLPIVRCFIINLTLNNQPSMLIQKKISQIHFVLIIKSSFKFQQILYKTPQNIPLKEAAFLNQQSGF